MDDRRAKLARKIRVLAKGLIDATPARVPPETEHGRKRPVQPVRRNLARGHAAHLLHQRWIPGTGGGKLGGEYRRLLVQPVAMDGVYAKEHGDAKTRIQCDLLNLSRFLTHHMQKRARPSPRPEERFLPRNIGIGNLHHLRGLFLQRHTAEDFLHTGFENGGSIEPAFYYFPFAVQTKFLFGKIV